MTKSKVYLCEFCGKQKKNKHGKMHTKCGIIFRRLNECKPENRPWVASQIKEGYGINIIL